VTGTATGGGGRELEGNGRAPQHRRESSRAAYDPRLNGLSRAAVGPSGARRTVGA